MTYCYECECGHKTQKTVPLSEFEPNILCGQCAKIMEIDLVAQHGRTKDKPGNWPMESDAAGVHPDQAKELSEYATAQGVPTEINPKTGNPVLTSQSHHKAFCEATGMYERNTYFGATPKNDMQMPKRRVRHG